MKNRWIALVIVGMLSSTLRAQPQVLPIFPGPDVMPQPIGEQWRIITDGFGNPLVFSGFTNVAANSVVTVPVPAAQIPVIVNSVILNLKKLMLLSGK